MDGTQSVFTPVYPHPNSLLDGGMTTMGTLGMGGASEPLDVLDNFSGPAPLDALRPLEFSRTSSMPAQHAGRHVPRFMQHTEVKRFACCIAA